MISSYNLPGTLYIVSWIIEGINGDDSIFTVTDEKQNKIHISARDLEKNLYEAIDEMIDIFNIKESEEIRPYLESYVWKFLYATYNKEN